MLTADLLGCWASVLCSILLSNGDTCQSHTVFWDIYQKHYLGMDLLYTLCIQCVHQHRVLPQTEQEGGHRSGFSASNHLHKSLNNHSIKSIYSNLHQLKKCLITFIMLLMLWSFTKGHILSRNRQREKVPIDIRGPGHLENATPDNDGNK